MNECTEGANNCHHYSLCTDTEGSFDCSCVKGEKFSDSVRFSLLTKSLKDFEVMVSSIVWMLTSAMKKSMSVSTHSVTTRRAPTFVTVTQESGCQI